ncbi:hypothetical protein LTR17_008653 [Elasticomyces elasticus]|nr:hypothetical protein LTR17_008653 [Elasticomyces elasticus]
MTAKEVNIASEGDVILICSSGESLKQVPSHRLRVSAGSLTTGSSVFKAMLGPHFKEGRQLASSAIAIGITLPDDDPEAMIMLCRALHLQLVAMPEVLTPAALLALSVVTDKYDCRGTLRFASEIWIRNALPMAAPLDLINLLIAAYMFQQAKVFNAVGREVILKSEGRIRNAAGEHPIEIDGSIEHLNKTKHRIEQELVVYIEKDILAGLESSTSGCKGDCMYKASQVVGLQRRLSKVFVWPVSNWLYQTVAISLETVLQNLGSLDTSLNKVEPCGIRCCNRVATSISLESAQRRYAGKARLIEQSIPYLCYRCIREDGHMATGGCNHPA